MSLYDLNYCFCYVRLAFFLYIWLWYGITSHRPTYPYTSYVKMKTTLVDCALGNLQGRKQWDGSIGSHNVLVSCQNPLATLYRENNYIC